MPSYTGSDGARLHYDDQSPNPDGNPIIALAGGAARHPSYLGDLAGLATHHRLVVPHLRGVGDSPLPSDAERASFWRQAEDIEELRVHLGLGRVHLLGHSAGTRLAISYAVQFPDRLASLILLTPPAGYLVDTPSDAEELAAKRRGEPAFDEAVKAWAEGPDQTDDDGFTAWYVRAAPMSYAQWGSTEQKHANTGGYSFAANRAYFSVAPPEDLAQRLRTVWAPVLVMAGAEDCGTGVAPLAGLAKLFPNACFISVEGSGHYPWVEQPAAFREAVDGFFASCASL